VLCRSSVVVSGDLGEGVRFLHRSGGGTVAVVVLFCSCGYFGVTCVAAMTKKFGALASTMTTTARKALTLFLSFFLFPKPAMLLHVFGGILFVLGLSIKTIPTPQAHRSGSWGMGPRPVVCPSSGHQWSGFRARQSRAS
jgi:hypothetical protein